MTKFKILYYFVVVVFTGGFSGGSVIKNPPVQGTRDRSLGQEDLLDKKMATQSSILAWKIP